MTENKQKTWYLGLLAGLSGSLLIACAVQTATATDIFRENLWAVAFIFSGILFIRLNQKIGKIMEIPIEYIKGLQRFMIVIIFAGLVTIFLTTDIKYGLVAIIQAIMWTLETYASIFVAIGTFLLAIFTGYLALQTKKAVEMETKMKCRELHTIDLRNVIREMINFIPSIIPPDQIRFSSVINFENVEKLNTVLVDDLKKHLPKEQIGLFEDLQRFKKESKEYVEESQGIYQKIINEAKNKTGLIYDIGFGKDGCFAQNFVDSIYVDIFQIAKGQKLYYPTVDYETQPGGIIILKGYGGPIIKAEKLEQQEKGKEVYTTMRNELSNSDYIQEAKKLLNEQQELNLIREKILNDFNIIASIPLLPGDCKFIKTAINQ